MDSTTDVNRAATSNVTVRGARDLLAADQARGADVNLLPRIGKTVIVGAVLAAGVATMGGAVPAGAVAAARTTAPATAADTPVPDGFKAQSTSWPSAAHGFVLGTAPCATGACTWIVRTVDGGATWSGVGTLRAKLSAGEGAGITAIRFADDSHGFAYGRSSLFVTSDGGVTWRADPLPPDTRQIAAFATGTVDDYVMVSSCSLRTPPYRCPTPTTLWRAPVAGGVWTAVDVTLPVAYSGIVRVFADTVYASAPNPFPQTDALFVSTDGGDTWSPRPSPCDPVRDQMLADIAPFSSTAVDLLCVGDPGFSKSVKRVFQSTDAAATSTRLGTAGLYGIQSALAVAPNGTLIVASSSDGDFIYRHAADGWTWPLALSDGGEGWADPTFTSNTTAFVVNGPPQFPDRAGQLLFSTDAGQTWFGVDFYA
jgi:photosystem II stability/assembly factor-like uncharacterized protein